LSAIFFSRFSSIRGHFVDLLAYFRRLGIFSAISAIFGIGEFLQACMMVPDQFCWRCGLQTSGPYENHLARFCVPINNTTFNESDKQIIYAEIIEDALRTLQDHCNMLSILDLVNLARSMENASDEPQWSSKVPPDEFVFLLSMLLKITPEDATFLSTPRNIFILQEITTIDGLTTWSRLVNSRTKLRLQKSAQIVAVGNSKAMAINDCSGNPFHQIRGFGGATLDDIEAELEELIKEANAQATSTSRSPPFLQIYILDPICSITQKLPSNNPLFQVILRPDITPNDIITKVRKINLLQNANTQFIWTTISPTSLIKSHQTRERNNKLPPYNIRLPLPEITRQQKTLLPLLAKINRELEVINRSAELDTPDLHSIQTHLTTDGVHLNTQGKIKMMELLNQSIQTNKLKIPAQYLLPPPQ
jgi:hypothetical protein